MDAPRILLVDPDAAVRDVLSLTLSDAGYAVDAVADAASALQALESERFSLVVTEQRLPGSDGVTFISQVRETPAWSHLPVVILTMHAAGLAVDQAAALNVEHVLAKPFSPRGVLRVVRQLCGLDAGVSCPPGFTLRQAS